MTVQIRYRYDADSATLAITFGSGAQRGLVLHGIEPQHTDPEVHVVLSYDWSGFLRAVQLVDAAELVHPSVAGELGQHVVIDQEDDTADLYLGAGRGGDYERIAGPQATPNGGRISMDRDGKGGTVRFHIEAQARVLASEPGPASESGLPDDAAVPALCFVYDPEADALDINLGPEIRPGELLQSVGPQLTLTESLVVLDYDAEKRLRNIEILDASTLVQADVLRGEVVRIVVDEEADEAELLLGVAGPEEALRRVGPQLTPSGDRLSMEYDELSRLVKIHIDGQSRVLPHACDRATDEADHRRE